MDRTAITLSSPKRRRSISIIACAFFVLLICIGGVYFLKEKLSRPPETFPINVPIDIPEGATVKSVAQILASKEVIHSPFLLYLMLDSSFQNTFIQAGTYTFTQKLTLSQVAEAITKGLYRSPHVSVTLPEGFRARELKSLLPSLFSEYTDESLDALDGTLFPDTYFFSGTDSAEEVLTLLKNTFNERIAPYRKEISKSGFTQEEIIIIASILEREANDVDSKHTVSGILRNRLAVNMPLQVDATFNYILGKTSAELTLNDLDTDSPFNTYKNRGLPPQAIANPGIRALEAALRPTASDYIYYLTGTDGVFYYAKTFEEHKRNKERYLQ